MLYGALPGCTQLPWCRGVCVLVRGSCFTSAASHLQLHIESACLARLHLHSWQPVEGMQLHACFLAADSMGGASCRLLHRSRGNPTDSSRGGAACMYVWAAQHHCRHTACWVGWVAHLTLTLTCNSTPWACPPACLPLQGQSALSIAGLQAGCYAMAAAALLSLMLRHRRPPPHKLPLRPPVALGSCLPLQTVHGARVAKRAVCPRALGLTGGAAQWLCLGVYVTAVAHGSRQRSHAR